ncbi:SDR family NAD(P)-dependent oxidoreductase [Chryseobacterium sp. CT-SW4]|uniref:SDR family NAD(P)-dependent oxidoreductase n=1 Tax=Chryseobacterium sp. SW-1 TaxID=3157343 RepID=UPI003B015453
MNPFTLQNKTILITGASSGIGRSCSVECSKSGAHLILIARNEKELNKTVSLLEPGSKAETIIADITHYEELEDLIAEKVAVLGKVAGFIHCAGIEKTLPLKKHDSKLYNDIFAVNVISGFELAKILSLKKYKSETSSFVFISSVAGMGGEPGKTAYSASKGAVISGVRSIAVEFARSNIRVNSVSPAMVNTPILKKMFDDIGEEASREIIKKHPLGIGNPEDIANACIFLLSDAARWTTGSNLVVDGGYSVC